MSKEIRWDLIEEHLTVIFDKKKQFLSLARCFYRWKKLNEVRNCRRKRFCTLSVNPVLLTLISTTYTHARVDFPIFVHKKIFIMSEISRQIITAYEVTFWVDSVFFLSFASFHTLFLFSARELLFGTPSTASSIQTNKCSVGAAIVCPLCALLSSNWHEKCSHFCPLFSHPHACRHHSNYMRIFNNFSPSTLFRGAQVSATAQQQCLSLVHSLFEYA